MTVRLAVVVQHSPLRADILPRLLAGLAAPLVVTDPGGEISSAWRCYRECLRADVGDATHIVICQDDSLPCPYFTEAAQNAIAAKPEAAISFFLATQPARTSLAAAQALKKRKPWAQWSRQDWWPTVCASYPVSVAREIADWVDAKPRVPRGDDAPLGDFLRAHRAVEGWCTVPSLCEHPDDVVSLIGRRHMAGRNPARCARYLVDGDPRSIDWGK